MTWAKKIVVDGRTGFGKEKFLSYPFSATCWHEVCTFQSIARGQETSWSACAHQSTQGHPESYVWYEEATVLATCLSSILCIHRTEVDGP